MTRTIDLEDLVIHNFVLLLEAKAINVGKAKIHGPVQLCESVPGYSCRRG